MNTNAVRTVRKVGRPRPLKITTEKILNSPQSPSNPFDPTKRTVTDALNDLENLHISISNGNYDETTARDIAQIYNILKSRGPELDSSFKEQIDRYFVTLRNVSREDRLDKASRLRLLEVIELRATKWMSNENLEAFYREKMLELQHPLQRSITAPIPPPIMPTVPFMPVQPQVLQSSIPPLEPGEVLRSSGKFAKPTKVAGKNYYKDEIIIRNSDSGKVSPGARDRLVQITGPHEEAIGHAKLLVEDTIRRNASPIRVGELHEKREQLCVEDEENDNMNCFNQNYYDETGMDNFPFRNPLTHSLSMNNASLGKYTFNIPVGEGLIEVSGENVDLVKEAKLVLEEYFIGQAEIEKDQTPRILSPPSSTIGNSFLPSEISSSPFLSSSEDEAKPTSAKTDLSNMPTNNVSSSAFCCSGETRASEAKSSQTDTGNSQSMPNPYACGKIRYTREFLFKCAKLKYSKIEPKDFCRIAREHPLICREPTKMFDPEEYKEQWESQIQNMENSNGNEK